MDNNKVQNQVRLDPTVVRGLLEHDEEFFIEFFLGDELLYRVPAFHKKVLHRMCAKDIKYFVCAIPRDHAKTTLAKLAVLHYFLFSKFRYVLYVSNTLTVAAESCSDIVAMLEGSNFRSIFGNIVWIKRQEGAGFYKFKLGDKTCILMARGAGQQVRGLNVDNQRPQIAVVDDLEDNDNIATEELFIKLKRWFWGPFMKCLDKIDHKIIHLGNMISNKQLLKEHCDSPMWHSMRFGALLSNGEPLWPDVWTVEKLQADFKNYMSAGLIDVWFAEMMNMPIAAGMGLIRAEHINYRPQVNPGEIQFGFITIDPAISEENWAHKAAIVVHGWVGQYWQICDYETGIGIDPMELWKVTLELALKWQVNVVGIESVAYQASLRPLFKHFAIADGVDYMEFVKLEASQRKTPRIAGWAGWIKSHDYAIPQGDFQITEQLLTYDPTKKHNDCDLIDACAYGPQMAENYLALIMSMITLVPASKPQSLYQMTRQ